MSRLGIGVLAVPLVLLLLVCAWFNIFIRRVDPGTVGVVVDFGAGTITGGAKLRQVPTGSYTFINPFTERLASYPVSQQTLSMVQRANEGKVVGDDSVVCQDVSGIRVNIDVSILYRVDPSKAGELYLLRPGVPLAEKKHDDDLESVIVRREARNAVTIACGLYRFDEMYGAKRSDFGQKIGAQLTKTLSESYMLLDGVIVGEIHLGKEQADAIARKAVAEQEALQASFLKAKAEQEALAAIAKARGDAEAIRILNEQLAQSRQYVDYLYVSKWDGHLPQVLGSGGVMTQIKP